MLMYYNRGRRLLSRRPNDVTRRFNWEFFIVLSGRAAPYFTEADRENPCPASLWLLPPGATYSWWSDEPEVERVVFHFATLDYNLRAGLAGKRFVRVPLGESGVAKIRAIADAVEPHYQTPTHIAPLEFDHARIELSLLVAAHVFAQSEVSTLATRHQLIARRALAFYEGQLPRRPKVAEVAAATGVSAPQLRRIFQETFNTPPKHLFSTAQLEHAKTLAASGDLLIAEIARQSGFVSASHLCHLFRRAYGVTFSKWRTQISTRPRRPHLRATAFSRELEAAPRKFPKSRL